jgi:hypothetical protein
MCSHCTTYLSLQSQHRVAPSSVNQSVNIASLYVSDGLISNCRVLNAIVYAKQPYAFHSFPIIIFDDQAWKVNHLLGKDQNCNVQ